MATLVEELVTTISLDPTLFKRGAADVQQSLRTTSDTATRTADSMAASGKRAAEVFSAVKIQALSLLGVLAGGKGLEAFTRDAVNSMAALGRAALNIGVAAPSLMAFGNALARNGESAADAIGTFQQLANTIEQIKLGRGSTDTIGAFSTIGANATTDGPLQVAQKWLAFYEKFGSTQEGLQRGRTIGGLIGLSGPMMDALQQIGTVANLQKELSASRDMWLPTPEATKRMQELQHDVVALGQAIEGAGEKWVDKLEPPLDHFVQWMTQVAEKQPQAIPALAAIAGYLTVIAGLNFGTLLTLLARLSPIVAAGLLLIGPSGTSSVSDDELNRIASDSEAGPSLGGSWWRRNMPKWLGGGNPAIADQSMSPEQQLFLQRLSSPESGGDYNPPPNPSSSASGRYQFINSTWNEASSALGLKDRSPVSQDRAAWWLADKEYRQKTGRDLLSDLRNGSHGGEISGALQGRWITITPDTGSGGVHGLNQRQAMQLAMPSHWARGGVGDRGGATSNSSAVTIGTLNIHTQATDATGIAHSIQAELADITVLQANRGPR